MQKDKIKSPFYYFFYPFVYIMAGLILLFHFCLTALELTKTYGLMYGSLYSLLILAAIAAYSLLLYATGRLISSKLKKILPSKRWPLMPYNGAFRLLSKAITLIFRYLPKATN